jgi:peptidoglycan/LPS O-acetylase OafA/YrhL
MSAEPTPARRHFTTIDALRGFAALSVCLFHFGGAALPKLSSPLTTNLTSWGWTGVEVFFVISGFVIPYVLLRGNYHWRDGGNFLARRFVRIWPPSAVLIALTVLQYVVINRIGMGDPAGWTEVSPGRVAVNLAYAVPFTGYTWLNGILWTLAVEFQYYIVLALLFPLLTRHYGWLIAAGAISLVSSLLPFAETMLFLHFANYFAMGGVVLLFREQKIERWTLLGALAVMAAVAVSQIGWLPTLFATATALVIAFVPIRNRVFVFLGTISYSLYLVHILVGSTAEYVVVRLFAPDTVVERWLAQIAILGAAILGAWVFYLLVERHFVTWSQRLAAPREVRAIRSAPEVMPPAGL